MRRLTPFLVVALVGVLALLGGLSWDALAHAADPELARHEGVFTTANPAHVVLLVGIALVVTGVVGALDAAVQSSGTRWSSPGGRAAALGAAAVPVAASLAVAGWTVTRPSPSPAAAPPPAAATTSAGHHGSTGAQAVVASDEHRAEADALVTATKLALATAGYEDVAVAEAAGFRPVQAPTARYVHYVNIAHLVDPTVLDPTEPESLVYRSTPAGPVLEGAMYILPSVETPVPDLGGLAGHWHGHDDLCFSTSTGMITATVGPDGTCPEGTRNEVTPPMLHVWTIDRPGGPFAGL